MLLFRLKSGFLVAMLAVLSIAASNAASGHGEEKHNNSRVPLPKHNITKGDKCVEPTDVMRRSHMEFILHQRDKTMHQGIRTTRHSLKNCVNCHADPKTNSVLGKDGFCESCHTYAAVNIDCFSCHTDKANSNKQTKTSIESLGQKVIANTGGAK